jgi:hypothetical protein
MQELTKAADLQRKRRDLHAKRLRKEGQRIQLPFGGSSMQLYVEPAKSKQQVAVRVNHIFSMQELMKAAD